MTNKSSSKQHGLATMNKTRPKASDRKKTQKARARVKSAERQKAIATAKKSHLG